MSGGNLSGGISLLYHGWYRSNHGINISDLLHGSACNMTRYFTSCDSIVTSRRRVEIQSTSENVSIFHNDQV